MPLKWYSPKKKKMERFGYFDIENWLWKSEIGTYRPLDLECTLIYQKLLRWKSAIHHSIKLPFDVEVAEKFLNGI